LIEVGSHKRREEGRERGDKRERGTEREIALVSNH
jgi:hypothetical protein